MSKSWACTLVNLFSYSFSVSLPDKVRRAEEQAAAITEHNVCTPDPQDDLFGASSITLAGNAGHRRKLCLVEVVLYVHEHSMPSCGRTFG